MSVFYEKLLKGSVRHRVPFGNKASAGVSANGRKVHKLLNNSWQEPLINLFMDYETLVSTSGQTPASSSS